MFNIGDRVRVYKTNWGPKKPFIGHEYIISEVRVQTRSEKDTATTYILSRPADGDSPTGACCHVWYDSELGLVRTAAGELAKFDNKVLLNSIYGKTNDSISAILEVGNLAKYIENDVKRTEELWSMYFNRTYADGRSVPKIKNVIFNDPATIVFWSDGSKTVVKCQDDDWYDPEKGLAMAISKKALGNKGNYCNEIKKWLPKEKWIDWCADIFNEGNEVAKGITAGLCKPITIPELTINNFNNDIKHKESVQKAYDILIKMAKDSNNNHRDYQVPMDDIDAAIGYLGQALED